jgi:HEAT repeat protein
MIAAWAAPVLVLVAGGFGGSGGGFSWPGALEIDGRALGTLPEQDRPPAIERLVERHGLPATLPYLAPLLSDPEPEVRVYVGRLLARAGDPRAFAAAIDWLTAPGRPPVDRAFGLDLLAHAATLPPPARAAIEQAIRDRDAGIRMRALEALGRHEIGRSLPAVLGALDDDSREVRQQAVLVVVTAVGQDRAGAKLATLPLVERLDDADRLIRLAAIRALGGLRDPRAVPALVRVASEQTIDLRAAAADALGSPAMAAATPTLTRFARQQPPDDLARHAALALGEIATPAAVAVLIAILRAPPVPDEAKLGLRHAGGAAVEPLIAELTRGSPASAALAAALLGELGDRRATTALAAAADPGTGGAAVSLVAIDALARLGDPAAVPALARATVSAQPDIRLRAFTALRALADPRSVAVLESGLADADPRVRAGAAELGNALGNTFEARASAAALVDRLADTAPAVRGAAARALARIGATPGVNPGALARMLAALGEGKPTPRDPDELEALGDALEANAEAGDAERVDQAFLAADLPLEVPLARALAAAHAERPLVNRAAIDRAIVLLAAGGTGALAAADALATARFSDGQAAALARAFSDAESAVRERLCAAIARAPHGGAWLASLIAASTEPLPIRAAAAWSARDLPEARAALEAAARATDEPLAANARAALAGGGRGGAGWTAIRLQATDGTPIVGRWVTLAGSGVAVQAMTDETGVARVAGLAGAGAGAWTAPGISLRAGP